MKKLKRLLKLPCFIVLLGVPVDAAEKPSGDSILTPTFMTGSWSFTAGTAFVCSVDGFREDLLLTAHHLYGPAGGLEREIKWDELKSKFRAVTALSAKSPEKYVTSTKLVTIPGAKGMDDEGYSRDICCLGHPAVLAVAPPSDGEINAQSW